MAEPDLCSALVRILADAEYPPRVLGAGFLVPPQHVLTCAHVVADALGLPRATSAAPSEPVWLDFPFLEGALPVQARVVVWHPVREHITLGEVEDIAVLELDAERPLPQAAQPAPLVELKPNAFFDRTVRVCGFPKGMDRGDYVTGQLQGPLTNGWIQLDHDLGRRGVVSGFSGTAVWNKQKKAVIGMIVSIQVRQVGDVVAYLIPVAMLSKAWPKLDIISLVQPFSQDAIAVLKDLLRGFQIPAERVHTLFRQTVPESRLFDEQDRSSSFINCLDFLAKKKHQPPNQAPLLEFLERCRSDMEAEFSQDELDKLEDWKKRNADALEIDLNAIKKRVQHTSVTEMPVVLVKIEPKNLVSEKEFNLIAWCRYDGRDEQVQKVPSQSVPRDQLEAELVSIVEQVAKRFLKEALRLEPILPITLLNWNPHRIKLPAGPPKLKMELGTLYSVIFRSWERTYHPDYVYVRPKWPKKWETCPGKLNSDHIRCILNDDMVCEDLFQELDSGAWIFLALFPPPKARERVEEIFGAALAAGLPFIFWPLIEQLDFKALKKDLEVWLCNHPRDDWPVRLQYERNTKTRRHWNDLLVLWDDPEHLPPDVDYHHIAPAE